jgi:hypothetical protein
MHAAKLFDLTQGSISLYTILKRAREDKQSISTDFRRNNLDAHLKECRTKMKSLKSALNAVQTRRNKVLAHLDPSIISDPENVSKKSEITVEELKRIFVISGEVCNGVSVAYWDVWGTMDYIGIDDFSYALSLIEAGKKQQLAEYQK